MICYENIFVYSEALKRVLSPSNNRAHRFGSTNCVLPHYEIENYGDQVQCELDMAHCFSTPWLSITDPDLIFKYSMFGLMSCSFNEYF